MADTPEAEETTSENQTETQTPDAGEETTSENQQGADPSDKLKELQAQKEHWRKKHETLLKSVNDVLTEPEEAVKPAPETTVDSPDEWKDKMNFLVTRQDKGYTEEAITNLSSIAKGKGITLAEAEADPMFQAYLTTDEAQGRSENATPEPSPRSPIVVQDKTWDKMNSDERKTNFDAHRIEFQRRFRKGGN